MIAKIVRHEPVELSLHDDDETWTGWYRWTGEIDTWGKYTFEPVFPKVDPPVFLFKDEINLTLGGYGS